MPPCEKTAITKRCFKNAGQIYYGDVVEQDSGECVRHGQGRQIMTAMTVTGEKVILGNYEGAWKQDRMTGVGVYRWSDGSLYEGALVDGKMYGHGKLKWPEGSVYDGMWSHGEMTGQGHFENAFDGTAVQGIFHRNCFKQHDGTWINVKRQREEYRAAWLKVGAMGPKVEASMPLTRCTPEELSTKVASVLRENRVPLVLAESSVASSSTSPRTAAPLWCLEAMQHGCIPDTTVHVAYVAAEKRRQRDYAQIFQSAICQALLTYRPFALVFGESDDNPQDVGLLPSTWKLTEFFERFSFPSDLFDLDYFHGSGDVEQFLPLDKRGAVCQRIPTPESASKVAEDTVANEQSTDDPAAAQPPLLDLPPAYLLRFVLVSLRQLVPGQSSAFIRQHIGNRFGQHLPLHRVSAIIVTGKS